MASLPAVVEVFCPKPEVICFRLSEDERFHEERCTKTAILIRRSKLIVPETSSLLLCNIVAALQEFVDDIADDIPLNYQLLRVQLSNTSRWLEIVKRGRMACRDSGRCTTIRSR